MPSTADSPRLAPRILDNDFPHADEGLPLPRANLVLRPAGPVPVARAGGGTLQTSGAMLRIANLDHAPPPGYQPGQLPRGSAFNRNVLAITAAPRMPPIAVQCTLRGFQPDRTPIHWRLQCRHVLARHINLGNYQYSGRSEIHQDEWQGRSTSASFTLFADPDDRAVQIDHNDTDSVMGGQALLTVAALPPGSTTWLMDFVHLRIGGTNPAQADVVDHLERVLDGRNENILTMIRAVFAHESSYTQFAPHVQTRLTRFGLRFDFPDDPPHYPVASYDFGIGIAQYTKLPGRVISRQVAWDWRENIRSGLNLFLTDSLRRSYEPRSTWSGWARRAWRLYNGGGTFAAQYAANMARSMIGREVSDSLVSSRIDLRRELAAIPGPRRHADPPTWPPRAV